ncbi:MAG TPA: cyclodeaminase/cyclohydrolase family protein, partial [Bacteroidia bacterium]|nr:cyclodeaminase/cyclohydrolase family protein [Bacteroidia bacterium]
EFSMWAEKGQAYKNTLIGLVDEDTAAFNLLMAAYGLTKGTDAEKTARTTAIQEAIKNAAQVPFRVMETVLSSMEVIRAMAEHGNPNSVSDAGVGALAARSAVLGAFLNVKINAAGLTDKSFADSILKKGAEIQDKAVRTEKEILEIVNSKIG